MPDTLLTRLGITHPIIKAPMAGGCDTPELVAGVSAAGGLGMMGAAYMSPQAISDYSQRIRTLTPTPFGINLFVPEQRPTATSAEIQQANAVLAPLYQQLGHTAPDLPDTNANTFEEQFAATLESGARVLSFTFGLLDKAHLQAARARKMLVIGNATCLQEARQLEAIGVDAIVAQGNEAGGHRSTFFTHTGALPTIGTLPLCATLLEQTNTPVIAAGGIMTGTGIHALLTLGVSAAQLGTAFLTCPEAGIPPCYQQALLAATSTDLTLTRGFSGRYARGIKNRALSHLNANPDHILPFPLQNDLTRPLRSVAAQANSADYLSLWAGQGVDLCHTQPVAALMQQLIKDYSTQS